MHWKQFYQSVVWIEQRIVPITGYVRTAPNESLLIIVMEKFTVIKMNATTCMIEHIENRRDVLYKYITLPSKIDLLHDLTELTIEWSKSRHNAEKRICSHDSQVNGCHVTVYQYPNVPEIQNVWSFPHRCLKKVAILKIAMAQFLRQLVRPLYETSRLRTHPKYNFRIVQNVPNGEYSATISSKWNKRNGKLYRRLMIKLSV